MSKPLTPAQALAAAKAVVEGTTALLTESARAFAKGRIDFATLEAAAKRHTNATHAVGRASKHKKEA